MEKKSFIPVSIRSRFSRNHFEQKACKMGLLVCGADEVGRGPLAGPIVAAAVILKPRLRYPLDLTDSKLLTALQREAMFSWIQKNAWYAIAMVSARKIDDISISTANIIALQRAVSLLTLRHNMTPHCVLVDAVNVEIPWLKQSCQSENLDIFDDHNHLEHPWNKIISFYQGETKSCSIAAASIIAKVTRDRLMKELGSNYPHYLFEEHKGYATAGHYQQIATHGSSIIHRNYFLKTHHDRLLQLSFGESQLDDTLPTEFLPQEKRHSSREMSS
jgi:ribonuclease HII